RAGRDANPRPPWTVPRHAATGFLYFIQPFENVFRGENYLRCNQGSCHRRAPFSIAKPFERANGVERKKERAGTLGPCRNVKAIVLWTDHRVFRAAAFIFRFRFKFRFALALKLEFRFALGFELALQLGFKFPRECINLWNHTNAPSFTNARSFKIRIRIQTQIRIRSGDRSARDADGALLSAEDPFHVQKHWSVLARRCGGFPTAASDQGAGADARRAFRHW